MELDIQLMMPSACPHDHMVIASRGSKGAARADKGGTVPYRTVPGVPYREYRMCSFQGAGLSPKEERTGYEGT